MECNEINRILWNAMKCIKSYGIQSILHDFVFIDTDFDASRDYRRLPAGTPGAPMSDQLSLIDGSIEFN